MNNEFYLSDQEKLLLINGIKNGLTRFYKEREGKPDIVTEKNFISRQRASYVFDSIYHLANQHPELKVTAEIRSAGLSYEYVLLFFEERKIMVTFSQVRHQEDLPEYSEYRSEFTEGNRLYNPQLSFFREEENYLNLYKHLVVTYNGSHGANPVFICIGATTPTQKAWIYHEDLMESASLDTGTGSLSLILK
ncbi:hypothetical protein [Fredinandcohnia sp. 179-A 10B2 NHS]|uniref:hypothetical protein n=1 Tax=Fredinandcohnia sp. 179-A 10B2 NHS TaxID=3235176 RepID=UPI0039A3D695